jgi:hypothetical protein
MISPYLSRLFQGGTNVAADTTIYMSWKLPKTVDDYISSAADQKIVPITNNTQQRCAYVSELVGCVLPCCVYIREQDTQHNTQQESTQPTNSNTYAHRGDYTRHAAQHTTRKYTTHQLKNICASRGLLYLKT